MDSRLNFFHTNYLVYQAPQFGKNLVRPFFIFKAMFMVGYYNKLTVVQRQIVSKLFVKENKKLQGMNPMGLSAPWGDPLN